MYAGGKTREQIFTSIHTHTFVCTWTVWDSYQIQLWVCPNVEMGCERKSVGSRGVEPSHPVVTSHTAPPIRSKTCEALTFFSTVCEFRHWIFLWHCKTKRGQIFFLKKTWNKNMSCSSSFQPQSRGNAGNDVCLTPSSGCTAGPASQRILNGLSSVTPSKTCGEAGGERGRGVVKEGGWVHKNTQSFSHRCWTKSKTHSLSSMCLSACFVFRIEREQC